MKRKSALWLMLAVLAFSSAFLPACGTNSGGSSGSSLTSLEAQKLGHKKASQVFDDPVLWRMAPIARICTPNAPTQNRNPNTLESKRPERP